MEYRYFDWAATSPMSDRALDVYADTARQFIGNPSSLHRLGLDAAQFLALQREKTAQLLHVDADQITYTSGATESNAIVLLSQLYRQQRSRIIFAAFEHDSILQYRRFLTRMGFDVQLVKARGGYVDVEELSALFSPDTCLVSVMLVNNLIGTVQDIRAISDAIARWEAAGNRHIHFHCDAVQALGKIPVDLDKLGVDSASFSAHKIQGPRGVGILYHRDESLAALSRGGGQERGLRPGTEALASIAAMNAALEDTFAYGWQQGTYLRRLFEQEIAPYPHITLLSPSIDGPRMVSPFIILLSLAGMPSEVLTRMLSDRGFAVSSGSACSSNARSKSREHITGMGFSAQQADSAIRISFCAQTSEQDIVLLARAIIALAAQQGTA